MPARTPAERFVEGLGGTVSVSGTTTTPKTIGEYLKSVPGYGIFTSTNHGYPGSVIDPSGTGGGPAAAAITRQVDTIKLYGSIHSEKEITTLPYHFFVLRNGDIVNKTPIDFTKEDEEGNLNNNEFHIVNPVPAWTPTYIAPGSGGGFGGARPGSHALTGAPRKHAGNDIGGARGTPIVAIADGTIIGRTDGNGGAGAGGGYGNMYLIDHHNGWHSVYAHMDSLAGFYRGDTVSAGQQIGTMGSTGCSQWPNGGIHLHFEMRDQSQLGGHGPGHGRGEVDPNPILLASKTSYAAGAHFDKEISIGIIEPVDPRTITGLDKLVDELLKHIPSIVYIQHGEPPVSSEVITNWMNTRRPKLPGRASTSGIS